VTTIQDACRALLLSGGLADKLAFPEGELAEAPGASAEDIDAPARAPLLTMHEGSEKLPPLNALHGAEARVACLSRFAHHELMAAELFAWALLRFPEAPAGLRRGWLAALREELEHLRLYLGRLAAHDAAFGELPLSGYFWKLLPGVRQASDPTRAFLCMQGLTLEQANLDFTMLYRDAFRQGGDDDTARVLQQVHDDEIAHVRLARVWLVRDDENTDGPDDEDLRRYLAHVPFPLSAARAKGRRFEVDARRRAGLSPAFIAHVRDAKPYGPRPAAAASE
jgi:uncharacterized ferritin-like protein (DUF455 family)